MTANQRTMLFRIFSRLAKAMGWGPGRREIERARITQELFGEIISWSDFKNSHVDKMKARLIWLGMPENLTAARNDVAEQTEDAGERKRLIFAIERDAKAGGLSEGYIRDMFRILSAEDRADWRETLSLRLMEQLRNLIHNRSRRKAAVKRRDAEGAEVRKGKATPKREAPTKITLARCVTVPDCDTPF